MPGIDKRLYFISECRDRKNTSEFTLNLHAANLLRVLCLVCGNKNQIEVLRNLICIDNDVVLILRVLLLDVHLKPTDATGQKGKERNKLRSKSTRISACAWE